MHARIASPAAAVPGAVPALRALGEALKRSGVPQSTLLLVYLRTSQVNGASWNVDRHAAEMRAAGESPERISAVAAWRDTPYYSDAERAALLLAESAARLGDRPDAVPDSVWHEAARHFDESQLATLVLASGFCNLWHRVVASTRRPAGQRPG
ncbi:carboxymuconolactone decarboxylase family protein [Streptomyces sp. B8F3]|uniref:carboxymuconolactone decarboxylase family protein n=1 Tax=Streptomyces sp. B8F3 TaxID=3153573 RepID=UPI00325C5E41